MDFDVQCKARQAKNTFVFNKNDIILFYYIVHKLPTPIIDFFTPLKVDYKKG